MVTAEVKGGSALPQQVSDLREIRSDLKIYLRRNRYVRRAVEENKYES